MQPTERLYMITRSMSKAEQSGERCVAKRATRGGGKCNAADRALIYDYQEYEQSGATRGAVRTEAGNARRRQMQCSRQSAYI
jgi:hypothetical protein